MQTYLLDDWEEKLLPFTLNSFSSCPQATCMKSTLVRVLKSTLLKIQNPGLQPYGERISGDVGFIFLLS